MRWWKVNFLNRNTNTWELSSTLTDTQSLLLTKPVYTQSFQLNQFGEMLKEIWPANMWISTTSDKILKDQKSSDGTQTDQNGSAATVLSADCTAYLQGAL